jgi:hypothetical protein
MPEKSSAKLTKQRLLLLLLNYWPLAHVGLFAGAIFLPWGIACALATLFLLPPLITRALLTKLPGADHRIPTDSSAFLIWWATLQTQVIFNRLPFLEETIRLIPGLYSQWLRLWGAKIGRLTYWASGVTVLDRSFLEIGDDVVFGAGVRINPHVLDGDLLLAPVKIGHCCQVGGYSLLTAGTELNDDEITRAFLISPPFSKWKNGKRMRDESDN